MRGYLWKDTVDLKDRAPLQPEFLAACAGPVHTTPDWFSTTLRLMVSLTTQGKKPTAELVLGCDVGERACTSPPLGGEMRGRTNDAGHSRSSRAHLVASLEYSTSTRRLEARHAPTSTLALEFRTAYYLEDLLASSPGVLAY